MLVHVKTPPTEISISGEGAEEVLKVLREKFKDVEIDENTPFETMAWYQEVKADWSPGDTLYVNREKLGLSQAQLGEKIGKTRQYISDLENGRRKMTVKTAQLLQGVFDKDYRLFL